VSGYRLCDLLDLSILQKMADAHYRAVGMPIGITDAIDGSILLGAGWQDICTMFHRAHPAALLRCQESDDYIKSRLVEGEACRYKCKNGLWDIGVPIVVAGRHLATMFLGQFFYDGETPKREFFVRQARELGFDARDYLAALDRVPVFSREKVDYILEYNKALAGFIADLAGHAVLHIATDEKIRENERKFRAIFDQTYQLIGLLTVDGILLEANETALRFVGALDSDVIGKPFWETAWWAHSPEVRESIRVAVQQASNGDFVRFETTIPASDGTLRYIDFSLKPVRDEAGKVVLLIPEGRDISERKQAEQENLDLQDQLAQAQKMESIGRLAGGVAHDFNNMLGVILGNVALALEESDLAHPLARNLLEIRTAAEHSADLTRQLLAFARRQTVAPKVLDLNHTVSGALTILQRLVGEDIELVWTPGQDLWRIKMDPAQMDQVLMNLAANARDSICGLGKVSLETMNVVADAAYAAGRFGLSPGEYVVLTMTDDGQGMDPETLANVFEPFYTTKEIGKGTGLGLAIVYGVVQQSGGIVNAYSEPGKGSTFKVYLPRYVGKAVYAPAEPALGQAARGSETILLVEDDAMLLGMTSTMLARLGYVVLPASAPGEAMRLAAEHSDEIQLLVTDVVMPEMNGRELVDKLCAAQPGLKHVFISGYAADVLAPHGVLAEGVHFVQKPFSMHALAAKLREALDEV
jgi:PAS domain S-box-containing protein